MKTINFELSKKLNDLGLLDNIETEYIWRDCRTGRFICKYNNIYIETDIKTLTLEEAIDILPGQIDIKILNKNNKYDLYYLEISKWEIYYKIRYLHINGNDIFIEFGMLDSILEAIEKMLEYLINNNLIGKEKETQENYGN